MNDAVLQDTNDSGLDDTQQQQQQQLLLHHPINNFETFCTVPGRLTLLSNQKKYRVSIGEIQRRMGPPEGMNASILGGILRKAKNKDGGQLLREQLRVYGVELPLGQRKQSALSCFSSLVEEEAVQMANDFQIICQRDYPIKAVAKQLIADVGSVQDAYVRRLELFYASKFLNRILDLHTTADERADILANFSTLTHSFGPNAVKSILQILIMIIEQQHF